MHLHDSENGAFDLGNAAAGGQGFHDDDAVQNEGETEQ